METKKYSISGRDDPTAAPSKFAPGSPENAAKLLRSARMKRSFPEFKDQSPIQPSKNTYLIIYSSWIDSHPLALLCDSTIKYLAGSENSHSVVHYFRSFSLISSFVDHSFATPRVHEKHVHKVFFFFFWSW